MKENKMEIPKVGDVVKAKKDIVFSDGSVHFKDSLYIVNKENEAYFQVNHENYFIASNNLQRMLQLRKTCEISKQDCETKHK